MEVKVGDKVTVIGEYVGKVVNINEYREPCFKYAIDLEGYDEDVVFVGEEQIKVLEVTEMKQWYVFEMNGFTEEEAQDFFNRAFAEFEWAEEHSMGILHLTDKGVADLKKHVFKQEVTE